MRQSTFMLLLLLSCAAAAKERSYSPPHLDNGQPDMQGMWIALNTTPLQRPPGFSTLVIDEAQAAKLLAAVTARFEDRNTPTEPTEYFDAMSIAPKRGELLAAARSGRRSRARTANGPLSEYHARNLPRSPRQLIMKKGVNY